MGGAAPVRVSSNSDVNEANLMQQTPKSRAFMANGKPGDNAQHR
jgi:hypothetical protein